jgi:hypothetical protein
MRSSIKKLKQNKTAAIGTAEKLYLYTLTIPFGNKLRKKFYL